MFNPAPFQPLSVFFELEMGGMKRIYESPNIPVNFEFKLSTEEAHSVNFTLFDEAGWEVEPFIWNARDPDSGVPGGTFSFGYKGSANVESEKWSFQLEGYKPRFVNGAFSVNIWGTVNPATLMMSSNPASGTVEEIIKKITDAHGIEYEIDPPLGTKYMMDLGKTNRNTTEKREMKHSKQAGESDWRYINRLCYWMRDQEGKCGYRPYLESINGKKTLRIVKGKDNTADYKYVVQEKDTVVLDWSPDMNFTAIFNEQGTDFNGFQSITGYTQKMKAHSKVTEPYQDTLGYDVFQLVHPVPKQDPPDQLIYTRSANMPKNVSKNSIRSRHMATSSPFGGINPALVHHIQAWSNQNTAQLVVMGDPRIVPVSPNGIAICEVLFYYPMNYLNRNIRQQHHSSGYYYVSDVTHNIGPGEFTTTYNLKRAGIPMAPEQEQQLDQQQGGIAGDFGNSSGGSIS